MTELNIYLTLIALVLLISLGIEIYKYKAFLSPGIWIFCNIFLQYVIGAFYLINFPELLVNANLQSIFIKKAMDVIFIQTICFSLSYFLLSHYLENKKTVTFHFQIEKWDRLTALTTLGLFGVFSLFSLVYYNFYGMGAYSSMRGMGWANWLLVIFLVPHCFLYAASMNKESRLIGAICFLLIAIFFGFLLNRRINTITLFWAYLLVVISPFSNGNIKKQVTTFLSLGLLAVFFIIFVRNSATNNLNFLNRINTLLTSQFIQFYDLAFTIQTSTLKNITLPLEYLVTYIPFKGYVPYVKELNYEFSKLPEIWKMGKIYYHNGGLSFTDPGILFLFGGQVLVGLVASFWGLFLGLINWQMRAWYAHRKKNDINLGLYALIWMSNSSLFFPNLNDFIFAFIMVIFLGKMMVVSYEKTNYL